jgi:LmbE family N-acetylglucosaminyl deacetylase
MTLLLVAPHADDAELGAGASINRWLAEGHRVVVVNLSDTQNINGEMAGLSLRAEAIAASALLGLDVKDVIFGDFPTRHFSSERQRILDFLIQIRDELRPDVIIGPSISDTHQDHGVVANEIQRAFRNSTILGFDTYWNIPEQKFPVVVEVSRQNISAKVRALSEFESQSGKKYMQKKNILSQAAVRGLPRGFDFAEAFSVVQISMNLNTRIARVSAHE